MRRALPALAVALAAAGCAAPAVRPLLPGHVPPAPEVELPKAANVEVSVVEAVPGPEEDTGSYAVVYVGGREAGRVPVGPRSQERRWGFTLPPGNHLFRFEYWVLPPAGDWTRLDEQWQPPERFIRVDEKSRVAVSLKFVDGGRRHSLQVSREAHLR